MKIIIEIIELIRNTRAPFSASEELSSLFPLFFFLRFVLISNQPIDIISRCHSRYRYRFRIIPASGWRNLIGAHVIPDSIRALACHEKNTCRRRVREKSELPVKLLEGKIFPLKRQPRRSLASIVALITDTLFNYFVER